MSALLQKAELTMQSEMARIRRLTISDDGEPIRPRVDQSYKTAKANIFEGVILDPDRAVLPAWKDTMYDRTKMFLTDDEGRIDGGDGYGICLNTGGPFKVRCIHGSRIGEVKSITAIKYSQLKKSELTGRVARFEPVPDKTPECEPILPAAFPSDSQKARAIAGKALKKAPGELSFPEILKFFVERKSGETIFKL